MNRAHIVTTRTGLQIGGHYIPPAVQPDPYDAEIQRLLLARKRNERADRVTSVACFVALLALVVIAVMK